MDPMRTVHTLDELLMLPRDHLVNGFRARAGVRLEIPGLERAAQVRAQESLNELQENNGALAGAFCMLATLIYGIVQVIQRHDSLLTWRGAGELLAVMVVAFLFGFAARFVAAIGTRLQFARRCRLLHHELSRDLAHNPMLVRI
jgi:hypothetical protein